VIIQNERVRVLEPCQPNVPQMPQDGVTFANDFATKKGTASRASDCFHTNRPRVGDAASCRAQEHHMADAISK